MITDVRRVKFQYFGKKGISNLRYYTIFWNHSHYYTHTMYTYVHTIHSIACASFSTHGNFDQDGGPSRHGKNQLTKERDTIQYTYTHTSQHKISFSPSWTRLRFSLKKVCMQFQYICHAVQCYINFIIIFTQVNILRRQALKQTFGHYICQVIDWKHIIP